MEFAEALEQTSAEELLKVARTFTEQRLDSWQNDITGFGTDRDKTTYTTFGGSFLLTDQQLSNIYHGDDLAARMVDIVPDEMLREGFSVDVGDAKLNTAISDVFGALDVRKHFADAARWGRLFGGGAVLIGADDGLSASVPLVPERAQALSYLYTLDRRYLWPLTWYQDPGNPKLGQPETYMVAPASANVQNTGVSVVHETRLVIFGGATTGIREREINRGWDHSVLHRAYDALRAFNTGWKAVEIMLTDGNQSVFKVRNLAQMIGANGADYTKARLMTMDLFRSVMRAMVLDAGTKDIPPEEFERQSVSMASIPETLDKFCLRLAAAVQIPVTILMGQSPAGMNATGDSDFRWFYDRIRSQQKLTLEPQIQRLVRIMLATKSVAAKKQPDAITVKFPSLWTETPTADAARILAISQSDKMRIDSGELLPEEVALTRAQPDGFSREILLTDEAKAAREVALKGSLDDLEDPPEPPMVATPGVIGKAPEPNQNPADEVGGARSDAAENVLDQLSGASRTIIVGGPRTGKSTTAARAGERYKRDVRSTDELVGKKSWSDSSQEVSTWFDREGDWIVEGVAAGRALRKWLAANPEKKLDATVVYFCKAVSPQSNGQRSMSKGCEKVWREVAPELKARGVAVIERDA